MQQGSAYDANAWLLARVRRVRALHGDRAPHRTKGAVEVWRSNWVWLQTSLTVVSLLCIALPLDVGLRVRATMGQRVTLAPPKPPPPLVRDALIRLLSVTPAARLTTVAGTAEVVAWSPDGRLLAAGYSGGALLLWDVARGRLAARVAQAHRRFVGALTWSPDGRLLATAAADGTAVLVEGGRGRGRGRGRRAHPRAYRDDQDGAATRPGRRLRAPRPRCSRCRRRHARRLRWSAHGHAMGCDADGRA